MIAESFAKLRGYYLLLDVTFEHTYRHRKIGRTRLVALFASYTMGVLHAQTKPRGYAIVETDVTNVEAFAREYLPAVSKVIAEAGGKFLLRGGRSVTVEGAPPKRLSIVEFETFEQAKAMFDSDPYRAASEIGHRHATFRITVVEGLPQ